MHFFRKEIQQNVKQNSNNSAISQREYHSINRIFTSETLYILNYCSQLKIFPPLIRCCRFIHHAVQPHRGNLSRARPPGLRSQWLVGVNHTGVRLSFLPFTLCLCVAACWKIPWPCHLYLVCMSGSNTAELHCLPSSWLAGSLVWTRPWFTGDVWRGGGGGGAGGGVGQSGNSMSAHELFHSTWLSDCFKRCQNGKSLGLI